MNDNMAACRSRGPLGSPCDRATCLCATAAVNKLLTVCRVITGGARSERGTGWTFRRGQVNDLPCKAQSSIPWQLSSS